MIVIVRFKTSGLYSQWELENPDSMLKGWE